MALQKSGGKRAVEGVAGGRRVNRANRVGGQENPSAIRQRKKTAALAEFEENVAAAARQELLRTFFHGILGDVLGFESQERARLRFIRREPIHAFEQSC